MLTSAVPLVGQRSLLGLLLVQPAERLLARRSADPPARRPSERSDGGHLKLWKNTDAVDETRNVLPLGEVPIIQAPMAGGPSTPALTAAVTRAGGFGFLAGGYLTPDQLAEAITTTRRLTGAPFGVNLFLPSDPDDADDADDIAAYAERLRPEAERLGVTLGDPRWDDDDFDDKLDVVDALGVPLVSFTFGCPTPATVDRLHRTDSQVAVTVTSEAEAAVAEAAGADLLVVQGTEAGGHQGGFLDLRANRHSVVALVAELRDSVGVPLVGSGGIMTGADAAAVLRSGAVAVQLGTALLCTPEAGTSPIYRRVLLEKRYPETIVTRAYSGRFARGLANEFAVSHDDQAPQAYPQIHHLTRPLRVAATRVGDTSVPNFWAGTGWTAITADPARSIVRRIAAELGQAGT